MAEENEDLVVTENADGTFVVGGDPVVDDHEEHGGEDMRLSTTEDHGSEEEQGHEDETAEEAEARKERNRQRRRESKDRRREYVDSLKRELAARDSIINDLTNRVSVVERKSTGSEMAQLEAAEKEAATYYNHFKDLHAKAIQAADGTIASDAAEKMFVARQRLEQIGNIKKAFQGQKAQPPALDPRILNNAQEWMERNSWYDPQGGDADSSVVMTLDRQMAKEGWDPKTKEYWDELDSRAKKYLPHRTSSSYNKNTGTKTPPRVPVAGSGKETSGARSGGYVISAARVQALKDAGSWDDPKKRAEGIRRYQEYDKQQKGAN